jgi:hypothetical protein
MTNVPSISVLNSKAIYYDPNSTSPIEPPEEEKMALEWQHYYGIHRFKIDLENTCHHEAHRLIWNSDRSYEAMQTWKQELHQSIEHLLHENSMIQYLHNVKINIEIEKEGDDYWALVDVHFNDEHFRYHQSILNISDIKF